MPAARTIAAIVCAFTGSCLGIVVCLAVRRGNRPALVRDASDGHGLALEDDFPILGATAEFVVGHG